MSGSEPLKKPSMNDPSGIPQNPADTPPSSGSEVPEMPKKSSLDPVGNWAKFLGGAATPDQVDMFIRSVLKMFDVVFQQSQAAARRSAQKLKDAQEGR